MNRIFKYLKGRKGITLVWMAFMLAVLLMLAGMAIDIAYMYYVKNQLQVAADASSLAGAAQLSPALDSGSAYTQLTARQEAWKFACKNSAAGQNVYLVNGEITDNKGKVIGLRSCVDADIPADLNNNNSENGDIVVGHWRSTNDVACQTTWESAGSGFFCRANGNTGLTINALKARPRRTNETPGMPRVGLFIGQIFSLIGADWSAMSAGASAIATLNPPYIGPFPICLPSCNLNMPLKTEWGYDDTQPTSPEINPILCSDPNLPPEGGTNSDDAITPSSTPPGQQFFLASSTQSNLVPKPGIAWTNFDINDCNVNPSCDTPNKDEVLPYIYGQKTPPDICNKNICTTNGTIHPILQELQKEFLEHKKTITIGGRTVDGWEIFVPVVSNLSCGVAQQTCPGDPKGRPYTVKRFTKILLTDVITTGHQGIRIIGLENPRQETFSFKCKKDVNPRTIERWITSLGCVDCNNPLPGEGGAVHLVK